MMLVNVSVTDGHVRTLPTLIYFHIGYRLPFIHGDKPFIIASPAAAEINHKLVLVAAQSL